MQRVSLYYFNEADGGGHALSCILRGMLLWRTNSNRTPAVMQFAEWSRLSRPPSMPTWLRGHIDGIGVELIFISLFSRLRWSWPLVRALDVQ